MDNLPNQHQPAENVRSALRRLRWLIRGYVLLEGLAISWLWIFVSFWVIFAIDYGPVLLGFNELPKTPRSILLGLVGFVLLYICFRWIFMRCFRRLEDRSMAVLLERQFGEFQDSLITSVQPVTVVEDSTDFFDSMLDQASQDASEKIGTVRLRNVFNLRPLVLRLGCVSLLGISIATFALASSDWFKLATDRIIMLSDETWPRRSHIELVGLKVSIEDIHPAISETGEMLKFKNHSIKVGRGSAVKLHLRAESESVSDEFRRLPRVCTVYFRTSNGERGMRRMKKIGSPKNGYQQYSLDEKPFNGVTSDISFDIVGGDHRISNYRIEMVDNPIVIETRLACDFPTYLQDPELGLWNNSTIKWASGSELPSGTKVSIRAAANKSIKKVYAYDVKKEVMTTVSTSTEGSEPNRFEIPCGTIDEVLHLELTLIDSDGVISSEPHRVYVTGVADQTPSVVSRIKGIGTLVTPDVRLPVNNSVTDDHRVDRSWIEVRPTFSDTFIEDLEKHGEKEVETVIDFQKKRKDKHDGLVLQAKDGSRLEIVTRATDRFDLTGNPNIGSSDRITLEIVSPNSLLRHLEHSEVALRRRLEIIFEEMTDAQSSLNQSKEHQVDALTEIRVVKDSTGLASDDVTGTQSLSSYEWQTLLAQRAVLQSRKSSNEVEGIASEFRFIREQLINNRVDSEDRKERLKDQIADPLQKTVDETFVQLATQIELLDSKLKEQESSQDIETILQQAIPETEHAIDLSQQVLDELDNVLKKLVKYEDYNGLLDIVRELIETQKLIREKTQVDQKEQILKNLFN